MTIDKKITTLALAGILSTISVASAHETGHISPVVDVRTVNYVNEFMLRGDDNSVEAIGNMYKFREVKNASDPTHAILLYAVCNDFPQDEPYMTITIRKEGKGFTDTVLYIKPDRVIHDSQISAGVMREYLPKC